MAHGKHSHTSDSYQLDAGLWLRGRNALAFIALISWVASIAGYFINPDRFFQSWLFAFLLCMFIPLGSMFFNQVGYLTGAAWSVPMRRIAENIMITIPLGFLLFLPVLAGIHSLYEWSRADVVAKDAILTAKAGWLTPNAFAVRAFIYIALWSLWAW